MKPLLALYLVTSTLNQHDSDSQCLCYSSKHLKYRQKMSCWFGISPRSSRIWDMLPQTGRWCHSESVFEFAWVVSLRHTQAKLGAGLLRNRERSRNSGRRSTTFEYKEMSSLAWSKSVYADACDRRGQLFIHQSIRFIRFNIYWPSSQQRNSSGPFNAMFTWHHSARLCDSNQTDLFTWVTHDIMTRSCHGKKCQGYIHRSNPRPLTRCQEFNHEAV